LEEEANAEMKEEQNIVVEDRMEQIKGEEELIEKNEAEAGQNEVAEKYFHQECYDKCRIKKKKKKKERKKTAVYHSPF